MTGHELPADNRLALRRVARAARKAALATTLAEPAGEPRPYASLVTVAFDHDLSPILLLSQLADHTRNLVADPKVSLLLDGTEGLANPQTGPRVTLVGTAQRDDDPRLAARFLARHPSAAMYAGFADFAYYKVTVERAHFVGGFARAVWFAAPLGLASEAAAAMAEAEADILAHMNEEHFEAIDRMAHRVLGLDGTGWRMAGIDPDGCDLVLGERFARLAFAQPVDGPAAARLTLIDLAT